MIPSLCRYRSQLPSTAINWYPINFWTTVVQENRDTSMHVTDAYLRAWKPPKTSSIEVSDTTRGRVGLVWRQHRRGEIRALIRPRTSEGRRPRLHCGSWPAETIQQIAARARLLKSQIDHGVNPPDEGKVKAATAVTDAAAVADRLDQWQAARAAAWSPRT